MLKYKYHFTELMGFTFTKGINAGPLTGLTVRGEFAYIHNQYNQYKLPSGLERFTQVGDELLAVLSNGELFAAPLANLQWRRVLHELKWVAAVAAMEE